MSPADARLVAVDWGTTSLRGALLDARGRVLAEHSSAQGILSVAPDQFAMIFEANFDHWMRTSGTFCLISGMAGSRQGWREAPYCPCPAGFGELARALAWIEPGRIALVPGLCCEHEGAAGEPVPDVMRGEEVQVFGAMRLTGLADGLFVLPGTHSKWAEVRGGRITGFRTFMTGEFFALLSQHSLLARTLAADAPFDAEAFARGVRQAQQGPGLLHSAFSARTLGLFGCLGAEALASYLSGLVIGEELRAQAPAGSPAPQQEIVLIGSATLTARYAQALALLGLRSRALGSEATWAGLHALAATLG